MRSGGKKPDCRTSGSCCENNARSNAGRSPGFSVPGRVFQHQEAGVFRPSRSGIKSVIYPMPDFFRRSGQRPQDPGTFLCPFPGLLPNGVPPFLNIFPRESKR
ncbi:MAG: hypothetical protein CW346_02235 [Bacillaceae bacterium]|nr:hypothetical protein [Bacillaceae bacterium]